MTEEPERRGVDLARAALRAAREATRVGRASTPRRKPRIDRTTSISRDPQPLGSTLNELIADQGWQQDVAVGGVIGRWESVVGDDLAAHVTPLSFSEGILFLQADSTAWATQVRLMERELLQKLAAVLGSGTVNSIEVSGPAAPSWRRGSRVVKGRGPRDTYG
jgi:predicted nucleic acid-binding Zn ribbon protein